uniref:NAD(P)-binding domain-containing protein n=1 Tax=Helicotheca tamesis TaxID=374047 RepID=A0A6U0H8I3_9STRA|eukprot:CAMPEP_0185731566 /NCGR_PEP_ID=MMETSP1171-20130828/13308_1 /TAXON_ID=374046 /ORGANISM="Helicotheca tamensis, Strain CCMP826" /LENGTH=443 /DNA_ID=CAMNT_0028400859 /DNA_START=20 /DNA_END=1351 /DNA_ORIENTATION=+
MRVAAARNDTSKHRNGTKILISICTIILFVTYWSWTSSVLSERDEDNFHALLSSPKDGKSGLRLSHSLHWRSTEIVQPHVGYKKVLVTGGAGFIGSHVSEYLLNRGDDVVIIDEVNDYYDTRIKESNLQMLLDKYGEERVKIYRGDICNVDLITKIFEEHKPEWVCHMAARAGVRPSIQDPYIYIHSNIEGTTRLMELSHKHGVKNFVFASSSSVYGGSKSTFFSESENVDHPISPYAASKKSCELMSYTYHHLYKLNVTGLRFFTVFGPRGRPDMAPFIFIDRVSRGVAIQQYGDGSSSRDYTYISDIVDGVVRAVDRPYPYQVFNLGKGSGTSLKEFIGLVGKTTGKEVIIDQMPDQPGDVPYTCADVSKAQRLLGYKAKVTFEEGIKKTVAWYNEAYKDQLAGGKNEKGDQRRLSYFMEDEGSVMTVSDEMLVPGVYWPN